ncbi:MAG: acyltransferase domain-containing protein [Defluviitaleaceae bacterium]|nr:acyltransferase domain-containing protein [Defluviitaleaceae bacterium]
MDLNKVTLQTVDLTSINLNDDYIREVNQYLNLPEDWLALLCKTAAMLKNSPGSKGLEKLPEHLKGMPHALYLLSLIPQLKAFYNSRRIPLAVMTDTLRDFTICMNEHHNAFGHYGIGDFRLEWLLYHFTGKLFWLGRLQFKHIPFPGTAEEAASVGLNPGCDLLDVHIPRHGPMGYDDCAASYKQAVPFFQKHFPEYDIKGFYCGSWLLSPELKKVLPPESNIIRFQDDYTIYKVDPDYDNALYEYIFRCKKGDVLPEDTSLQRSLKQLLDNGGAIGTGDGVIII